MNHSARADIGEAVVNLHITEACNYSCEHCYAHWVNATGQNVPMHKIGSAKDIISALHEFFFPGNERNPLGRHCSWERVRFNFVGGEAFIIPDLPGMIEHAHAIGAATSFVTNGHYMKAETIERLAPLCSIAGFSVDANDEETNRRIGRIDRRTGHVLGQDEWQGIVEKFRSENPAIRIKINTVVNRHNQDSDMTPFIEAVKPDRWKILRVLPTFGDIQTITDEQFSGFVNRHRKFGDVMAVEDNEDMRDSYIMVDPRSRFFQDGRGVDGHVYSAPIITAGVETAFSQIPFSPEKYDTRYRMTGRHFTGGHEEAPVLKM